MSTQFGIDRLLTEPEWQKPLLGLRLGLVAHPASVTTRLQLSLDALNEHTSLRIVGAWGPQHGMRGEKQDNMVESQDYLDPRWKIPVWSLYGDSRRPTPSQLNHCDAVLFDLQDIGSRVYTFLTTLLYMMEACAQAKKKLIILDRPNPIGRPVEGLALEPGWESFVGCAPGLPMRHGLTLGEFARYFASTSYPSSKGSPSFEGDPRKEASLHRVDLGNLDLTVIPMRGYEECLNQGPGYGWPLGERAWVNPSPNAPTLNMTRCFPGSVIFEGTHLSEMRGTTRSLEGWGGPDLPPMETVLREMYTIAPEWMKGSLIRVHHFEPTFQKHRGKLCQGLQFHTDHSLYDHEAFKPYRLAALFLKVIHRLAPSYPLWRDPETFTYEYESNRPAIDIIQGGPTFRQWVEEDSATPVELEQALVRDENFWREARQGSLLYGREALGKKK